jgi:hypothetical protein
LDLRSQSGPRDVISQKRRSVATNTLFLRRTKPETLI